MVLLLLTFGSANAALLSRAGGQAYYDDVLNITWLADANLSKTNDFGVAGIYAHMTWDKAQEWIGAMNTANYLGTNTWRLPAVTDTATSGCNYAYTGTDCGYNMDLGTGEMAHMFYSTLGNLALYDTSGASPQPGSGLSNMGPFSNLVNSYWWSGTTYAPDPAKAWAFVTFNGYQDAIDKSNLFKAWAVSPGDSLAAVPLPGSVWMLGSALGALRLSRRKVRNRDGLVAQPSIKRTA
jgi:hypothetical protein